MQRPGISSLLNVTSHLVSPVFPNISRRPTSNPVEIHLDVFHFYTTTLSCPIDQMLLLIMDGQDRQEQVHIVQVTTVQLYKSSFILVLSRWWQHPRFMMMTRTTVMIRLQLEQVWWWLQHLLYDDDDIDDHQSEVGTGVAGGPSVNKFHEVSLPTLHPYNCRHHHRHQHHHCHPGHRQHHHHHYCHHHRDPHRPHLYVPPLSFNRGQDCRVHLEHYLDVKKLCPYDRKHWQTQPNLAMHTPHTAQDKSDKDANKSKRSADIFLQIVIRGETSHGQWRCRGQ